jgi:hypothetical protein
MTNNYDEAKRQADLAHDAYTGSDGHLDQDYPMAMYRLGQAQVSAMLALVDAVKRGDKTTVISVDGKVLSRAVKAGERHQRHDG